MKFCDKHWDTLKTAMRDRGLWHLVSKTDDEARVTFDLMAKAHIDGALPVSYDPLLDVADAMSQVAVRRYGLEIIGLTDDGCHVCPVCVTEARDKMGESILHGFADGARKFCLDVGYLSPLQ